MKKPLAIRTRTTAVSTDTLRSATGGGYRYASFDDWVAGIYTWYPDGDDFGGGGGGDGSGDGDGGSSGSAGAGGDA